MDDHKFCFIMCSNDDLYLEECLFYLNHIYIPEGYEVEILSIKDAVSMAVGYNEGMKASNAQYKIYMHQDVFILNKNFLYDILKIFHSDPQIGMIGMVGSVQMPVNGVMWHGYRVGTIYGMKEPEEDYANYLYDVKDGVIEVKAVDGLLIATNKDLEWREDLFDGWDFYDVSQSFEMCRKGFRVVVPAQRNPWCLHDDGILNLKDYDKYRKLCIKEYPEFFENGSVEDKDGE